MSLSDLLDYYAGLLIIQYSGKPRADATVRAQVRPVLMPQADPNDLILPLAVQDGYNLLGVDTAVGKQLDILGKYTGVQRTALGFSGSITLDDTEFLALIKMSIATNSLGSSLADVQSFLAIYFPGVIYVFDYKTMRISYLVDSDVTSSRVLQLFVSMGLLPRPMGVAMSVIAAPVIASFFGCCTYEQPVNSLASPLNTYEDYQTNRPFITYQLSVI